MDAICDDLAAEHAALDALVAAIPDTAWDQATPAPGWAVRDQISHLWFFDDAACLAITDPDAFATATAELLDTLAGGEDASVERGRGMAPADAAGRLARRAAQAPRDAPPARSEDPRHVVRPGDGSPLVRHGAADGDVGPRAGRRRRPRSRARGDRAAPPRRPHRRAGPTLRLRDPRARRSCRGMSASSSSPRTVRPGPGDPTGAPTSSTETHSTSASSSPSAATSPTPRCASPGRPRPSGWASPRPSPGRRVRVELRVSSPSAESTWGLRPTLASLAPHRRSAPWRSRERPVVAPQLLRVAGRVGYRLSISLNSSAAAAPIRRAVLGQPVAHPSPEGVQLVVVGGLHRRLELAGVGLERGQLGVDGRRDVLGVVGLVGLPQQQRRRAGGAARPCSGKKCGSRAATMPSHASRPAWRWSGWRR